MHDYFSLYGMVIFKLRYCYKKPNSSQGFRLRLVGHSLGGAIASLIAIMLRKKSREDLGFSPDIVSAVGYATPPCVSRELAEGCSDFVTTVVMQVEQMHCIFCQLNSVLLLFWA